MPLIPLPYDLLRSLGSCLDLNEIKTFANVDEQWSALTKENLFWKKFASNKYPDYPAFRPDIGPVPWREVQTHVDVDRRWYRKENNLRNLVKLWQGNPSILTFLRQGANEMVSLDIHSTVRLWSVKALLHDESSEEICSMPNTHFMKVTDIVSEGNALYTIGMDTKLTIWNITTPDKEKAEHIQLPCRPTCLATEGKHLVAGFADGTIGFIDRRCKLGTSVMNVHAEQVNEMVLRDNYVYSFGDDQFLRATDKRTKKACGVFDFNNTIMFPTKICRSSTHLYCSTTTGNLYAFDLDTFRLKNPHNTPVKYLRNVVNMKETGDFVWASTNNAVFMLNVAKPESISYLYSTYGTTSADMENDIHVFSNPLNGVLIVAHNEHEFLK